MFVLSAAALTFGACSHPGGTGGSGSGGSTGTGSGGSTGTGGSPADCTPGTELCPCLTGNTCLNGLTCADDVNKCIVVDGGSNPGTGGTTPGTGGSNPGTGGGNPGTGGGNPGTGGSNPGTGGTTGGGTNLVTNGDLSQGTNGWKTSENTPSNSGVNNGQYCITLDSNTGEVIIGWGDASVSANLSAGGNYTLSYQAMASASLSEFTVHVGASVPDSGGNYTLDESYDENVGTGPSTFTHMFTLTNAEPQAGVAFLVKASGGSSTVCVDNLSITQN